MIEPGTRTLPQLADIRAAAARIADLAWPTPMLSSPWLSEVTGAEVWLKLETMQATGSFKVRGAVNALARLRVLRPDVTDVVTASAGNHGQALAYAARALGLRARVYLPAAAPLAKHDGLVRLGAEAISTSSYEAAEGEAHHDAATTGTPYVSPYDDADVVAGAGTVALEMIDRIPALDSFFVPLGGGGLLAGTALAVRALTTGVLLVGCEAAASPAFTSALAAGRPVTVDVKPTIADGLAGNMEPDTITFAAVRDGVDRVDSIDEPAIVGAMRDLIRHERLIVEGASAVAIASLLRAGRSLAGRRVGIILSGRNVDAGVIERVLRA